MGAVFGLFSSSFLEFSLCFTCGCFSHLLEVSLPSATRFGHLLVLLTTFGMAKILSGGLYSQYIEPSMMYSKILSGASCADSDEACVYRQMTNRASLSLVILFGVLSLLSIFDECANRSLWSLKFIAALGLLISFLWVSDEFFEGYALVSLYCSIFWLLAQGLLLIDFSHDLHDIILARAAKEDTDFGESSSKKWYVVYLLLSLLFLGSAGVGIWVLFSTYKHCELATAFTIITISMGVITTAVSLLEVIGRGLLTPCILFAYNVMTCWYALQSIPYAYCATNESDAVDNGWFTTTFILFVTTVLLLYCIANGSQILNIFNPDGEGVLMSQTVSSSEIQLIQTTSSSPHEKLIDREGLSSSSELIRNSPTRSSGSVHERVFFHALMLLSSCYLSMVLTNWNQNGNTNEFVGASAMWVKIVSQWIVILMQCKVLMVEYQENTAMTG
jgi:hypothetical protein